MFHPVTWFLYHKDFWKNFNFDMFNELGLLDINE